METATTTMATTSTATPSEAPAGSSAAFKAEAVVTAAQVVAGYQRQDAPQYGAMQDPGASQTQSLGN